MSGNSYWPSSAQNQDDGTDQSNWLDPNLIDPALFGSPMDTDTTMRTPQQTVQTQNPTPISTFDPTGNYPPWTPPSVHPRDQPTLTPGYAVPTPGYPVPTTGYPVPTPGYPVPTPGYPVPTPGYPVATPGFPLPASTNPSPAGTGSVFSSGFSPSPYPDPADVFTQTPITTPGASEPGTTKGKKRGRASSPGTDKPRRTRRKTTKSTAAGVNDDTQAGDSASAAATPVSGKSRSRATTRSKSKASDNRTNTPAAANPPGKRPRAIYVRPSRIRQAPADADANALLISKKDARVKDTDQDEDENVDVNEGKQGRGGNEIIAEGAICDFCANHPVGKTMFAANPECDWVQIASTGADVFNRECSNCANYRSQNRQPGEVASERDHMCRVPGPKTLLLDFKHKRYGDTDPANFAEPACDRCLTNKASETCDVDAILGYYCSHCRRDQRCTVKNTLMPLKRPTKLKAPAWYRHACDRCLARHLEFKNMKGGDCCNWITDRRLWDEQRQACSKCVQDGAPCMDDKNGFIAPPSHEPPPTTWQIRDKFEVDENRKLKRRKIKWYEYVEATTSTNWRRKCTGCQWAGPSVECLVMWHQSNYACERCTQFGVDCTTYSFETGSWTRYPIYDLSRVGFGHYTPYVVCKPCKDNGRNCDRMRPCDSCTNTGSQCDALRKDIAHGCIARAKIAAHGKGQVPLPPGPLYYLALGYGPAGVNDIKDGRSVEHWIGPVAPVYGINTLKDGALHYRAVADLHRDHRPPDNVAPPGISTPLYTAEGVLGAFKDVESRALTVQQLSALIIHHWPDFETPIGDAQAYRQIWNSLRDTQNEKMTEAGVGVHLPVAPPMPRTFQGNPVLSDQEAFHQGLLGFPAHGATQQNSYVALDNMIAAGTVGYQQVDDDQQTQQTQPSFDPEMDIDITEMNQDQVRRFFGLGGGETRGRFLASRNYIRASKIDKRQKAFANRTPERENANKESFNPFLSFVLDANQKPRHKPKGKSSRWKVFNPLEDLDMEKWHKSNSQPDEDTSVPRLFSVVNGQWMQPAPQANVLDDVPYQERGGRTQQRCAEPGKNGIGRCNSRNVKEQDQAVCQSLAHRNTAPGYFPVCNDCVQGNVKDMLQHDHNPIMAEELLNLRAYLCNDCAAHMSSSVQNAAEYRAIGARRIYGVAADREHSQSTYTPDDDPSLVVEFHNDAEALTGCSCANRMFGTALCRFHRLRYTEETLKFSALMQEWRLSCFKKAVCPSCIAQRPLDKANLSADVSGFRKDAPTAWACVNCNDWVANEKNDKTNQPSLVDKELWNLDFRPQYLDPRQTVAHGQDRVHEIEDVDMGGL